MPPKTNTSGNEAEDKLTWEELQEKITLRNVPTLEVEDLLFVLENMNKGDISVSAYEQARQNLEGYIF